jgi:hypothetical protein
MMEKSNAKDLCGATIVRGASVSEKADAHGRYLVRCVDRDGKLKWEDVIDNVVCTYGKNLMLDTAFAGAVYSVTGPFMGLISSVDYGAGPAAADTMASHAGWKEAGSGANFPLYNVSAAAVRATCVWSAANAGAKALSAVLSFNIVTTGGTVKGCFVVYGTNAVNTIADANGTLYSAGTFSGGDKTVAVGDTIQVSYSASL